MLQQCLSLIWLLYWTAVCSSATADTDQNRKGFKAGLEESYGQFSDPSAKAAIFKHIDDMTFIEIPHGNSTKDQRAKRNAVRYSSSLWPNGRVPYIISSDFSGRQREVILNAMRHWEDNTCVRFHPRTSESHYTYIMSGDGCYSYVGRVGRYYQPQGISLGPGCVYFRTAVHELGHAIGFFHEHTRPDRDEYVDVLSENIRDGRQQNFNKKSPNYANTLGYGYDYASIMHYTSYSFSNGNGKPTIQATDDGIVFGSAQELSPLDILKANRLYGCVAGRHPPISTVPPSEEPLALPDGITCGAVMEAKSGVFYSPGYPNHVENQRCAWVIRIPDGYQLRLNFPGLNMEESSGCSKDYIQIFYGKSLDSAQGVVISRRARKGKFCSPEQIYTNLYVRRSDTTTVYYKTDGGNIGSTPRGIKVQFTAVDVNECSGNNRCHSCTNLVGSYQCNCNDGYYHSMAANTCFDVNECAYANGGCEHTCDNSGGSYRCECNGGYNLQADGLSCAMQPEPTAAPSITCGSTLTRSEGALQTPNWPDTYPLNFECEWNIRLPDTNDQVELSFEGAFGIAGNTIENCLRDYLKIYDGGRLTHTICDLERPSPIRTTSSNVRLVFHAGPSHGPLRKGFRITYRTIRQPTIPLPTTIPTTMPTTQPTTIPTAPPTTTAPPRICGGTLSSSTGSFQTPNWPETYPFDFDCEWTVQVPVMNNIIQLTFDGAFGIAGKVIENCPKDHLKIYQSSRLTHTICDLVRPSPIRTTSNSVRLVFTAGPSHGPLRKGFRISYSSISRATIPPSTTRPTSTTAATTRPTIVPPTPNCPVLPTNPQGMFECGGYINPRVPHNFGPPNFPSGLITEPLECSWRVIGSSGDRFRVRFMYFDIPSSNECSGNHIAVYNGFTTDSPLIEKMCGEKCNDYVVEGNQRLMLVKLVIKTPGPFKGFYAGFEQL